MWFIQFWESKILIWFLLSRPLNNETMHFYHPCCLHGFSITQALKKEMEVAPRYKLTQWTVSHRQKFGGWWWGLLTLCRLITLLSLLLLLTPFILLTLLTHYTVACTPSHIAKCYMIIWQSIWSKLASWSYSGITLDIKVFSLWRTS